MASKNLGLTAQDLVEEQSSSAFFSRPSHSPTPSTRATPFATMRQDYQGSSAFEIDREFTGSAIKRLSKRPRPPGISRIENSLSRATGTVEANFLDEDSKNFILTPREMYVLSLAWDNMRDCTIDYDMVAKESGYTVSSARVIMAKVKRKLADACHSEMARLEEEGRPSSKRHSRRKTSGTTEVAEPVGTMDQSSTGDKAVERTDEA